MLAIKLHIPRDDIVSLINIIENKDLDKVIYSSLVEVLNPDFASKVNVQFFNYFSI